MTDKLHFGAMTAYRANHETNTFMRTQLLKRLSALVCLGFALFGLSHQAQAQSSYVLMGLTNHVWKYEESNTDLGTAWRATNYNDSAWLSGRGILAFENGAINANIALLTNTVLTLGAPAIITHYFRTSFVLTNDPVAFTVVSSNYIDDGAVVFLNGVEAFRYNLPEGNILFATTAPAANPAGEGVFIVSNLPPNLLRVGTNVLAVEVHQNGTASSDIDFGMALIVRAIPVTPLIITNQPVSLVVVETKPASFSVGVQGTPAYFRWFKDGVSISNATANPFTIPITTTNDAGNYYVVVTNASSSVTSIVATLTILPDTNGPVLVEADGTSSLTNVLVSFSELITTATASSTNNYRITNTISGASLTIFSATLVDGTNVLLTTSARTSGQNYILVVNRLQDVGPRANVIATNSSIPVRTLLTLIAMDGAWKFWDPYEGFDTEDLGTAWKEFTYDTDVPNDWGDGNGVLYNHPDSGEIPGPLGKPLSQTPGVTSYFRKGFDFQGSLGGLQLVLTHIIDDGAIIYLNGNEVLRYNMPSGTVDFRTVASATIGDVPRIGPATVQFSGFRSGSNVLAVELHQRSSNNFDKVFGLQLDAKVQSIPVGPVVITSGPDDLTVIEGQSATFRVVQAGALTFQWQQNSNNIAGATNDIYTIPFVTSGLNGMRFRVGVSNAVSGVVFSTNATLRVISDTNRPTIVSAFLASNNTIVVSFSEVLATVSANNPANYTVTNSAGLPANVTGATLTNGTNVILSFGAPLAGRYTVVVNNVTDAATTPNVIAPNSAVVVGADYLIAMDSGWKYLLIVTNATIQSTFAGTNFNDSSWSGPSNALLYVEPSALTGPKNTPLSLYDLNFPTNANRINTFYFRQKLVAPVSGTNVTVRIRHYIDDGMLLHLNGVEIYRYNMPAGAITASSQAIAPAIDNATLLGPFQTVVTNLVGGTNVFAVEVHQVGATSSDVVMGVELSLSAPSIVVTNTPPTCTPVAWSAPVLRYQQVNRTNLVLSWTNPVTNTCGGTAIYTLQGALGLSNPPASTLWSNLSVTSPYNVIIPTNSVPQPFGTRFYQLRRF